VAPSGRIIAVGNVAAALRGPRARRVPERIVFFVMGALAVATVVLAAVLNWPATHPSRFALAPSSSKASAPAATAAATVSLTKDPKTMLANDILGFEPIALQSVPGEGGTAAEGVYATTDMRLAMVVDTGVYVRIEGFATNAGAAASVQSTLKQYPAGQHDVLLNKTTHARVGYSRDRGTWVAAWSSGQYAIYVKSFFKDDPPAQKKDFLDNQGTMVAAATEYYDRTGLQGVQAQSGIIAPLPDSGGSRTGVGSLPSAGMP
jgi:hypothetical protein